MQRYAQLSGGVVHQVIESETDPDGTNGQWVACPAYVGPGYTANAEHTVWTAPVYVPPADPCQWLLDLGPFYDRFGAAKMAVLTSTDPGVVAIRADVSIRKWVDLTRQDVADALAYIGSKVPALTPALQAAILTTPVSTAENQALRTLYFK